MRYTPPIITKLLWLTCLISLISAAITPLFHYLFAITGPQEWLSLSWWGLSHYLIWQPISFLFVLSTPFNTITLSFLLTLAFNMYLLWTMGSDLVLLVGSRSFLRFYLGCGIFAGLVALLCMSLFGQYLSLFGPAPSILAMITAWALAQPEREVLLFFLIPLKSKWLALAMIGSLLLISLSELDGAHFVLYLSGTLGGYLYALIAWGFHSPFRSLHTYELALVQKIQKFNKYIPSLRFKQAIKPSQKVFNIKTGEIDNDDAFIDAMLEKISKNGEGSLSWLERERMRKISLNKQKKD